MAVNRQALLDAALDVFRRVGYSGPASTPSPRRPGSRRAPSIPLASKADLFLSLLEQRITARASQQQRWVTGPLTAADVAGVVRRVFAESDRDPAWRLAQLEFRVVAARDRTLNARYAQAHRATAAGIVATLQRLFEIAGVEPSRPLEELARIGSGMDAGRFLEDRTEPGSWTTDRAADGFCELAGLPDPAVSGRPGRRTDG